MIFIKIYFCQSSLISNEDAEEYINDVIDPLQLLQYIQFVILGFGALIILSALTAAAVIYKRYKPVN